MRIIIVNDQDEVIGHKERGALLKEDIYRAEEEIGLKDIHPSVGPKRRVSDDYNYFCQWYTLRVDKPAEDFVLRQEEVVQVKWFTRTELEKDLHEHPDRYLKGLDWAVETI